MRNLKKLVAFIVTLAMIATFAIPAFAAAPADVVGTDYEGAVSRLVALGVINGYPDGNFGPDDSITRAQFAAIVVRALGYESVAASAAGVTKFSDVAANNWASGYINLAVSLGIIKGYGDGKFGPEDKVLYEQAVTMVVRALGQDAFAEKKGGYPSGYLVQAKVIGFTNGVTGVAGVAATRGIVALLVDNAKGVVLYEQTAFGDSPAYALTNPAETFVTRLEVTLQADDKIVTQTPASAGLDANKFVAGGVTYTAVAGAVDVESLLGKKVDLWGSAADKIVLAENIVGTSITVKSVAVTVADAVYTVKATLADDTTKDYTIAAGAGAFEDLEVANVLDVVNSLNGDAADTVQISLVADDDAKIQLVNAISFDNDAVAAAATENKIAKWIKLGAYFIKQNDKAIKQLVIVKDGATVDYTAIKAGDILFVAENFGADAANCDDDRLYIKATSKTVAGTLEAAKPNLAAATSVKVEGTWYSVSSFLASIDASANIGGEITLTLDPAGKAYSIAGVTVASTDKYGVIQGNESTTSLGETVYKVKILTSAGDKVTYSVAANDNTVVATGAADGALTGRLAKYTLASDGTINSITLAAVVNTTDATFDTSRLDFNGTEVSSDVVLFSAGAVVKLASVKDDQTATAIGIIENADGVIVAMDLSAYTAVVTDATYAYVTDFVVTGAGKYTVDVLTKDGAKSFNTEDADAAVKGALVKYQLDASNNMINVTAETSDDVGTVSYVDASKIKVLDTVPDPDETTTYWFAADALVIYDVDADEAGATALTKADLYADMNVKVYLNADGDVLAVVVTAM